MLQARAALDNAHGHLRAHMFANASIAVRDRVAALVVPTSAVQWEGCCNVVFVKRSNTEYEPRKVHLGITTGTVYEVLSGVREGEEIVTQGSFLLKTEILKGSIGAGCCEVDPGA
jgi:cobalt-zinc-cadmium efflux system membrane fusion protein